MGFIVRGVNSAFPADMDLQVVEYRPDARVVTVVGEIDALTALRLADFLTAQLAAARLVVVDLDGVQFLSSAGLRVLFEVNDLATEQDRRLRLVCSSSTANLTTSDHRAARALHLRRHRAQRPEELALIRRLHFARSQQPHAVTGIGGHAGTGMAVLSGSLTSKKTWIHPASRGTIRTAGTPMPSAMRCESATKSSTTWPGSRRTNSVTGGPGSTEHTRGATIWCIPAAVRDGCDRWVPSIVADHCHLTSLAHRDRASSFRRRRSQRGVHHGSRSNVPACLSAGLVVTPLETSVMMIPFCLGGTRGIPVVRTGTR